jgi:hypothetical protein
MADMPVANFEKHWQHELNSLREEYKDIVKDNPDEEGSVKQVAKVLGDIVSLAGCTPANVGESKAWAGVVESAIQDRITFCKHLKGKQLFNALYGTYTVALNELKHILQSSAKMTLAPQKQVAIPQKGEADEGFQEQKRRKRRNSSDEKTKKNAATDAQAVPPHRRVAQLPTRNFFAPLGTTMETDTAGAAPKDQPEQQSQQAAANKGGRPPPIVMTSTINLISLQKDLKQIVKGPFEFRNTKIGSKVVSKEMADYSAIRHYLDSKQISYFTFFPKSEKPMKAVIRYLLPSTPAEDISNALVELGFSIISVRQMTSKRTIQEGGSQVVNLPLFLVTLPRTEKSQEIFKVTNLCNIIIKVEAYRAQNGLTQCYNCQQFGHVWANCKQPPRCLWCGRGHLHKECPEKQNEQSSPNCCNCTLKDGEQPHPSTYRGCSHAKEEMLRRKTQKASNKGPTGRLFSSNYVVAGQSFAAALSGNSQQQQLHSRPTEKVLRNPVDRTEAQPTVQPHTQNTGQSVKAPTVNSSSLDDMFKVATVVQQIMTELNGAVSEEDKIVAITKIVLSLMKRDGH